MSPTKNAGSVARQTSLQLIRLCRKGGLFLTWCVCDMLPKIGRIICFKLQFLQILFKTIFKYFFSCYCAFSPRKRPSKVCIWSIWTPNNSSLCAGQFVAYLLHIGWNKCEETYSCSSNLASHLTGKHWMVTKSILG